MCLPDNKRKSALPVRAKALTCALRAEALWRIVDVVVVVVVLRIFEYEKIVEKCYFSA